MEKKIILFVVFISTISFAADKSPDQILFEGLKVKAIDPRPAETYGGSYKEKSVGGLLCSVSMAFAPGAVEKYSCKFQPGVKLDFEAIYAAIDIKPINNDPDRMGSGSFSKSLGGLYCSRFVTLLPDDFEETFDCKWQKTGLNLVENADPKMSGKTIKDISNDKGIERTTPDLSNESGKIKP